MVITGIKQNKMNKVTKVMSISFITNVLLSGLKIGVGLIGHSSAIIADGVHSFSDLMTDIVAIFGGHMSHKPADLKHPYGHGKIEYLTSIAIGTVVVLIALMLIISAVSRKPVISSPIVIFVTLITIVSKYVLATYIAKKGRLYDNAILVASGRESMADVLSSIFVLASAIAMQMTKYAHILIYSDIVATVVVGLFILRIGYTILKDNVSVILEEQEINPEITDKINDLILKHQSVTKVDSLVILKYGPYYQLIGEIKMNGDLSLQETHHHVDLIEHKLRRSNERIKYITIHVSPSIEKSR